MLMVMEPVPVVPHMSVAVNDKLAVVADKSRIGYAALAVVDIVPTKITTNKSNSFEQHHGISDRQTMKLD